MIELLVILLTFYIQLGLATGIVLAILDTFDLFHCSGTKYFALCVLWPIALVKGIIYLLKTAIS